MCCVLSRLDAVILSLSQLSIVTTRLFDTSSVSSMARSNNLSLGIVCGVPGGEL